MSGTMINSVESKGNSGVYTTMSLKIVPRNDCNNDKQPKSNMAAHTGNICICWDITWGQVCLARSAEKCDLCEKKKHWRYKPYSQCLMEGFETAEFTSNYVLQEFTRLEMPRQHFYFCFS